MIRFLPTGMGVAMGLMMPFMFHSLGAQAALWFVLAHVAIVAAGVAMAVYAARRLGRVPAWARMHRPSAGHVAYMLCGGAIGFVIVHVSAHGLGVA